MEITGKIVSTLVALSIVMAQSSFAGPREQAKRIHDRLTGVPATNTVLDAMEATFVSDPTGRDAAIYAINNNPSFYNITVKNFASPWTNEAQDVFVPLNDYSATVIGLIRDDRDFRQVLHGNILYTGSSYSPVDNLAYEQLESSNADLSNINVLRERVQSDVITSLPADATAGVMTTRAAARAFFIDGTNRAMFRFTMMNHMCTDLEPLKDVSRTPDRVRQDVSRSPGGDSRIYLNNCVGCHAGMDGMAGAFAHYQYDYPEDNEDGGQLTYNASAVEEKHLINAENFKPGYITTGDGWINYWRNGQNSILGWSGGTLDSKGNAIGNGAKALGIELSNSQAFAQCQVDKVFKSVCFRDPNDYAVDRIERNDIVTDFTSSYNYNMKEVFADVAAWCKGS
jgi:hypothetical protein